MTRAIVIRGKGGPEVLRLENVTVGEPVLGEIKLRQGAAGDRKSTRLNSSHTDISRMPSSA